MPDSVRPRVAFFLPSLSGGGAEKVSVNLLKGLVDQNEIELDLDLALVKAGGVFIADVPKEVTIKELNCKRVATAVLSLIRYLREARPVVLLSHMNHANIIAILAVKVARSDTKVVVVEHISLTDRNVHGLWNKTYNLIMKVAYRGADSIVGVSQGVSTSVENRMGLEKGTVETIYNPVITPDTRRMAAEPVDHPWLESRELPVFLAIGRLTEQKNFSVLIEAFHLLLKRKDARLIILGEGELRSELEQLAEKLGVSDNIDMPGFNSNPYSHLRRANAFVLSSKFEGLPTALIESIACGCPVVSTDCPSGPYEILDGGKYGKLVPVDDVAALTDAMADILENPIAPDILEERSQIFSMEVISREYLHLLLRN